MTDAETVPALVQREIQYTAALEILHNLLTQNVIDLTNAPAGRCCSCRNLRRFAAVDLAILVNG